MKHSKLARLLAGINNTTDLTDDGTPANEPERATDATEQLKLTHPDSRTSSGAEQSTERLKGPANR